MGSNSSKIQLAVLYNQQIRLPLDYIQGFTRDKELILHQYHNFNDFIEKQSLKKISNILILQTIKQQQPLNQHKNISMRSLSKIQQIHPAFRDLDTYIGKQNQVQKHHFQASSIRKSLIQYIKKYSLQYLNLYIWSDNVIEVDVEVSQMCYICLISNNLNRIKEHIKQQERSKIINAKFKRLVKDLFRKIQVALIYSDSRQHQKYEEAFKKYAVTYLQKIFKTAGISSQRFQTILQFSQKTTSLYAQFIVCFHQQDLLQLVQFTKNLTIDSKIIYFGAKEQITSNIKKILGTWLTLNDLQVQQMQSLSKIKQLYIKGDAKTLSKIEPYCEQLLQVLKRCSHIKGENKKSKNNFQVIIYCQELYNIITIEQTKKQVLQILKKKQQSIKEFIQHQKQRKSLLQAGDIQNIKIGNNKQQNQLSPTSQQKEVKDKKNKKDKAQQFLTQVNLQKIQFFAGRASQLVPIIQKEVYTILILFDSTSQKLQIFKTHLRKKDLAKRVQITMLELNSHEYQQKKGDQIKQPKEQTRRKNLIKCLTGKQLKSNFSLKFQIGPIQAINLLNPEQKQKQYFQNKLGLKVSHILTSQKTQKDNKYNYLSQYRGFSKKQDKPLKSFQDFHIICSVKDYEDNLQSLLQKKGQNQEYLNKIKIIIYDRKQNIIQFFVKNGQTLRQNIKEVRSNKQKKQKLQALQYNQSKKSRLKLSQNVVLVHYLFQKIQEYLMYIQIPKISMAFFGKGVLKQLYEINNKSLAIINSRSFVLSATFISNNQLLKTIFQQNNVKISTQFQMLLIKFPVLNRMNEFQVHLFEEYIKKYAKLWNIGYNMLALSQIAEEGNQQKRQLLNFQLLKQDIKKSFYKCRTYELLKVTDEQFKYFYIDRIDMCETLVDLQITCIYIYSLPHGFQQIINSIFRQPFQTSLSIKIFCNYLLVLFLNFYSVQNEQMQKFQLVIYLQDKHIKQVYQNIKQGDIIFNRNFLHCCKNENQNDKNHRIVIQIQNVPFLQRNNIKSLVQIERFAFYKQSAQYLMAPFTKFKLKRKYMNGDKYNLMFEIPVNYKNLFISQLFQCNKIQYLNFCQVLKCAMQSKDTNKKKNQNQFKDSIYQKAQTTALQQQKKQLQISIKNGSTYRQFLNCVHKQLYCSATKQLTSIIKINQKKKKNVSQEVNLDSVQQNLNSNLLKVQKAMLQFKTAQYKKSLELLTQVLNFLKEQKIQGHDMWIQNKILSLKFSVQHAFKNHKIAKDKSKKNNFWKIDMNDNQSKNQVGKIFKNKMKWNLQYEPNQQLFLISSTSKIQTETFKIEKGTKFKVASPTTQFGKLQFRQDEDTEKNIYFKQDSQLSAIKIKKKSQQQQLFDQTGQKLLNLIISLNSKNQSKKQMLSKELLTKQAKLKGVQIYKRISNKMNEQKKIKDVIKQKNYVEKNIIQSQQFKKEQNQSSQKKQSKKEQSQRSQKKQLFNDQSLKLKNKKQNLIQQRQNWQNKSKIIELQKNQKTSNAQSNSDLKIQKIYIAEENNNSQIKSKKTSIQHQTLAERSLQLNKRQKIQWQLFQFQGEVKLVRKNKKFKVPLEKKKDKLWKNQSKIK